MPRQSTLRLPASPAPHTAYLPTRQSHLHPPSTSTATMAAPHSYDLIGIGFGPANVAIAGVLVEKAASNNKAISLERTLFIEKQQEFKWHPGMLLPGTQMQVSFLKDLATLRNPQSPITFIAYLHSQNRLLPFINRGGTTPSRKEYADYLSWAAKYVQDQGIGVAYGEEVLSLDQAPDGTIEVRSRKLSSGELITRTTKNLIISPGGAGRLPPALAALAPLPSLIHSSSYRFSIPPALAALMSGRRAARPLRIGVIGGGQSAAEVVIDLHSRLSAIDIATNGRHEIEMIFRNGSLKPSDDSAFANEIFDPEATDKFFNLPTDRARQRVKKEYEGANYSVVSPSTVETLYAMMYDQRLEDDIAARKGLPSAAEDSSLGPRISMKKYTEILTAELAVPNVPDSESASFESDATTPAPAPAPITLVFQHILERGVHEQTYDIVVCATGYQRNAWAGLLAASKLGTRFGLPSPSPSVSPLNLDDIRLSPHKSDEPVVRVRVPVNPPAPFAEPEAETHSGDDGESQPASSPSSTTPTTPGLSTFSASPLGKHAEFETHSARPTLYISRRYRLLPVVCTRGDGEDEECEDAFKSRVYLQGCEEKTHGISDTLLSVLGVRAGEVVDDMCAHL